MSPGEREFREEYAAALKQSLASPGEAALHRAYELGRKAIASGLGVLDVAAVHQQAIESSIARSGSSGGRRRILRAVGTLFAEFLSSFEMRHRQFKESLKASTSANEKLRGEIAERKRAEGELRRSALVLENAVEGISLIDEEGRFVFTNKAYAAMLGFSSEGLKDLEWRSMFLPRDRTKIEAAFERMTSSGKAETEARALRRDGSFFHCQLVMIKAVPQKKGARLYCFMKDVSERKRAEEERSRRLAESARAQALARSNADLQEFARVVAHDLQEPLRTIISYAKLLDQRAKGSLDSEAGKFIAQMGVGARRMSRLIRDLLAYARLERQDPAFVRIDASAAVAGALADLRAAIQESRARVSVDSLPQVLADPSQLASLFQNLIANAIKFRGTELPRIRISARRKGGEWVFAVEDNGIGFEITGGEGLFTLFRRLHTKIAGHGIGLAVCKRVVERHGGRIWAESEPGKGSIFFFTLPAGASMEKASREPVTGGTAK